MQFFRRSHAPGFVSRNWWFSVGFLGLTLLLSGCATAPGGSAASNPGKSIEDQVAERAAKRWQALIAGDLDAAYGYFSPATKATYPLDLYKVRMRPGIWRDAKVDSVKCADSVCEVTVVLTVDHARLQGIVTPVAERWIIQDGTAWYVYNG